MSNQNKNHNRSQNHNDNVERELLDMLADIDDDVVSVPREEYNELIAESTILRVVEHLVELNDGEYGSYKALRDVLGVSEKEGA